MSTVDLARFAGPKVTPAIAGELTEVRRQMLDMLGTDEVLTLCGPYRTTVEDALTRPSRGSLLPSCIVGMEDIGGPMWLARADAAEAMSYVHDDEGATLAIWHARRAVDSMRRELDRVELTREKAAEVAGLRLDTFDQYRSRGTFPPPDRMVSRTPLWRAGTVRLWLATRPGQGAGGGRPRKTTPATPEGTPRV